MFDLGFIEVVVVFVLALLVLGPERLPRVARMIGLWIGRVRAMFYSVRSELERELRVEEMRKAGYELKDGLEFREIRQAGEELKQAGQDIKADVSRNLTPPPDESEAAKSEPRADQKPRDDA